MKLVISLNSLFLSSHAPRIESFQTNSSAPKICMMTKKGTNHIIGYNNENKNAKNVNKKLQIIKSNENEEFTWLVSSGKLSSAPNAM